MPKTKRRDKQEWGTFSYGFLFFVQIHRQKSSAALEISLLTGLRKPSFECLKVFLFLKTRFCSTSKIINMYANNYLQLRL